MTDDTDLTTPQDNTIADNANDDDDGDLLLDPERDVAGKPEDNELVLAEKEAIADDEFDEPLAAQTDPGIVNEANQLPTELWEEGTGADEIEGKDDDDNAATFGMHMEEFADESSDDEEEDNPFLTNDKDQTG